MGKIKTFVQQTLGCGCPEDVFKYINSQSSILLNNILLRNKINIGNKLLIFVIEVNRVDSLKETLKLLVNAGKKERDSLGFNRFRLVIVADNPGILEQNACNIFNSLEKDERIHLHVIHKKDIPF